MDEWREVPFSEAVLINPLVRLKKGENYPFVDMASVEPSSKLVFAKEKRKFTGGGSKFQSGDTLMARITPCLENGKIGQFYSDNSSIIAHGSTEFIVIRGRPTVSETEFVYYLTKWENVRSYAINQMTGTSGRQRVPTNAFDQLIVPIPPKTEQCAIASLLGALDDKIDLNRRMNETLEAMARAIFKDWFVDFGPTRAKAEGRPPYLAPDLWALFPDALDDEDKPVGWDFEPLDEVASFLNGLALQKYPADGDEFLPVIKIAELRSGITDKSDKASLNIPLKYIVEDGDVLFSWSGSLTHLVWTDGKGALNQHLFKVNSDHYPKWLFYYWIDQYMPTFRTIAESKATTMGHIQRHHLREALTVIPNRPVLRASNAVIDPLFNRTIKNNLENRTLSQLRDFLLPKLMSGEIRLHEAEKAVENVV